MDKHMTFSVSVKEELLEIVPKEKHCKIAELSALLTWYGKIENTDEPKIKLPTDNQAAIRKVFTLLNKAFNIETNIFLEKMQVPRSFIELNRENADIDAILRAIKVNDPLALLDKNCCKRAYLRGVFIANGFVFEPEKSIQLEMHTDNLEYARLIPVLLQEFEITAKQSLRKKNYLIYVRGSEMVSDTLNVLGAHKAINAVIQARIVKDYRNDLNRRTNFETANIIRSASAASKQMEDIILIKQEMGFDDLPEQLKEMAIVRLENPDSSLTELGEFLDPPVGKSGVNHRLRKLSEIAEGLRGRGKSYDKEGYNNSTE